MKNQNSTHSTNSPITQSRTSALRRTLAKYSLACGLLLLGSGAPIGAQTLVLQPKGAFNPSCVNVSAAASFVTVKFNTSLLGTPTVQSQSPFIYNVRITLGTSGIGGKYAWNVSFMVDTNYACQRSGSLVIWGVTLPVKQAAALAAPSNLAPSDRWIPVEASGTSATVYFSWTAPPCANPATVYRLVVVNLSTGAQLDTTIPWTSFQTSLPIGDYVWVVMAGDTVQNLCGTTTLWGVPSPNTHFRVIPL